MKTYIYLTKDLQGQICEVIFKDYFKNDVYKNQFEVHYWDTETKLPVHVTQGDTIFLINIDLNTQRLLPLATSGCQINIFHPCPKYYSEVLKMVEQLPITKTADIDHIVYVFCDKHASFEKLWEHLFPHAVIPELFRYIGKVYSDGEEDSEYSYKEGLLLATGLQQFTHQKLLDYLQTYIDKSNIINFVNTSEPLKIAGHIINGYKEYLNEKNLVILPIGKVLETLQSLSKTEKWDTGLFSAKASENLSCSSGNIHAGCERSRNDG